MRRLRLRTPALLALAAALAVLLALTGVAAAQAPSGGADAPPASVPGGADAPPAPAPAPAPDPAPAPAPTPAPAPAPSTPSTPSTTPATPSATPSTSAADAAAAAAAAAEQARQQEARRRAAARARAERARQARVGKALAEARQSLNGGTAATRIGVAGSSRSLGAFAPVSSSTGQTLLLSGIVVAGLVFWLLMVVGFAALIRRGHTVSVIMGVLALVIAECALYWSGNVVPRGLFNPSAGGISLSIFEIVITAVLAGALVAGRTPQLTPAILWWCGFLGWLAVGTVIGFMAGNAVDLIVFSARAIVYVGLLLLAATVPAREYVGPRGLPLVILPSSVLAAVLIMTSSVGVSVSIPFPLSPVYDFGTLGADAGTVFGALGVVALIWAVTAETRRIQRLVVAVPLLVAPLFALQRAALIGAGLALIVVAIAFIVRSGRERIRLRSKELLAVGLGAAAIAFAGVLATTAVTGHPPANPIVQSVDQAFNRQGKASAAESRVNQWDEALDLIAARPFPGYGVGYEYQFYSPGQFDVLTSRITHNVLLDIGLRMGIVGIVLFVMAVALTFREGVAAWLRNTDIRIAGLALGMVAALTSLMFKGMVESIFEKYRLAVFLGIVLGLLFSAVIEAAPERVTERMRRRLRRPALAPRPAAAPRPGPVTRSGQV